MLDNLAETQPFLLTVEDHVITGGFGSALLEYVSGRHPHGARVVRMGVPERLIEHGPRNRILGDLGLNANGIRDRFKVAMATTSPTITLLTAREKK